MRAGRDAGLTVDQRLDEVDVDLFWLRFVGGERASDVGKEGVGC